MSVPQSVQSDFLLGKLSVITGHGLDACRKLTEGMSNADIERVTESLRRGESIIQDGKIVTAGKPQDPGGES